MLDRIRRRLLAWPHRGANTAMPVVDPYEGAQRLADQNRICRTLAEIRSEAATTH